MYEKYATPGMYLDTDDHGRLLEENREAYARDRAERIKREIDEINVALKHVSPEEAQRLCRKKESLKNELDELAEEFR